MLVLSRQRDETIMIGDDIEITIVDIRGDKVRLGITAPTQVSVHRKEVYDAIKAAGGNTKDCPHTWVNLAEAIQGRLVCSSCGKHLEKKAQPAA